MVPSTNPTYPTNPSSLSVKSIKSFISMARQFKEKTEEHILQGVNPGGYYHAVWCRDASYILRSWFHSGNIQGVLQQIFLIWSHQILPGKEKIIYGRGSPEMKYRITVAKEDKQKAFEGALPTTIYQARYSEVYGLNPDIDSTALMINTTSWILRKLLNEEDKSQYPSKKFSYTHQSSSNDTSNRITTSVWNDANKKNNGSSGHNKPILSASSMTTLTGVINFVVPCMLKAVDYLLTRDTDNDGLLEQNHNEDWMDTALRVGKIVYSQACWILALNNLSYLLSELGKNNESKRIMKIAHRTIDAVEQNLWSEEDGSYIDIQESHHIGGPYRTLTQDVSLYLIAISENTNSDSFQLYHKENQQKSDSHDIYELNNNNNWHPLKQQKLQRTNLKKESYSTLTLICFIRDQIALLMQLGIEYGRIIGL